MQPVLNETPLQIVQKETKKAKLKNTFADDAKTINSVLKMLTLFNSYPLQHQKSDV